MPCDDQDTVNAALVAAAQGPLKVEGDAGKIEARSALDLIAAANYLASQCAAQNTQQGLRITRLTPDGCWGSGWGPDPAYIPWRGWRG